MKQLKKGQYYGINKNIIQIDGLILTETEFIGNQNVDWHFHENVHFSYSLEGSCYQITKKEKHSVSEGVLIYHNSEDPHYNKSHSNYSRNFYLELEENWYDKLLVKRNLPEKIIDIKNPNIKIAIDKIYLESKINDSCSSIEIESNLINALDSLRDYGQIHIKYDRVNWVKKVKELIHDDPTVNFSLKEISNELSIHPVHLSRYFRKYFGQSFSEYIRSIKVHKVASLLKNKELSLIDICFLVGFYDQSQMSKHFKRVYKTTPLRYRKSIN